MRRLGTLLAIFTLGVALLVGCGSDDGGEAGPAGDKVAAQDAGESAEPAEAETPESDDEAGETVEANTPILCTYSQDGVEITTHIKSSDLFRVDAQTPQGETHALSIDGTFYVWGAGMPQGFKMENFPQAPSMPDIPENLTPEFIEQLPGNTNAECAEYNGSDDVFELPDDVTFGSSPTM